jgi:2-keto-4-pentenoate hydratase
MRRTLMLRADKIERAAQILDEARMKVSPIEGLPGDCRPESLADAYAIQKRFTNRWGIAVGYKIGCASQESQRLVGASGPFVGRLLASNCWGSPAEVDAAAFNIIGVEAEFAFRLGQDLPATSNGYSREEVIAAITGVQPIIEICDTRLANWLTAGALQLIADNAVHGALVMGAVIADWRRFDLRTHEVSLLIDGAEVGRGAGELVMGDPINALLWIVNDIAQRGDSLKGGDLVAAGTCTGLHFVAPGGHVTADFGEIGEVHIQVGG